MKVQIEFFISLYELLNDPSDLYNVDLLRTKINVDLLRTKSKIIKGILMINELF